MISNEKMAELKQNAELTLEFIEVVEELEIQVASLRKEKQYYMDEYKNASNKMHNMRKEMGIKCKECNHLPLLLESIHQEQVKRTSFF